jgi:hypothetical protein
MRPKLMPLMNFNPHTDAIRSKHSEAAANTLRVQADIHARANSGDAGEASTDAAPPPPEPAVTVHFSDEDEAGDAEAKEDPANVSFFDEDSILSSGLGETDHRVLFRMRAGIVSYLDCVPGQLDITRSHVPMPT